MHSAIDATGRLILMASRVIIMGSVVLVLVILTQKHVWNGSPLLRHRSLQRSQDVYQQLQPIEQLKEAFPTERSENGTPQGSYANQVLLPNNYQIYTSFQTAKNPEGVQNEPHADRQSSNRQKQTSGLTNTDQHAWGEERVHQHQYFLPHSSSPQMELPQQTTKVVNNMQYSYSGYNGVNQSGQMRQTVPAISRPQQMSQREELPQQLQTLPLQNQMYSQFQLQQTQESSQSQSKSTQLRSQVNIQREQQSQQLNQKSNEAQVGVSVPEQDPECVVPDAAEKSVRNPAWTASYPGSGAKLTWKLIRAITGIFTSDDHDHNGRVEKGTIVAVKTHFPSHTHPHIFHQEKLKHIGRAVLLTRNPINSIPSYHNFVYEQQNGLLNHSTRAPVEVWIKWRNLFYEQELQAWVDHQKYWLDNYPSDAFHLVSMEHLTSADKGPDTLAMLGRFLANGEPDIAETMVPPDRMRCIWEMFVNGKVPGERERRHSHRSGGPKVYPFTQFQLDQMISALETLKNEYPSCQELATVLDEYIVSIQETKTRIDLL
jgi:hypothetical protein